MYNQIRDLLQRISVKPRDDEERVQQEHEIKALLDANPQVLYETDSHKQTLLIWASACGNLSIVHALISKHVDLTAITYCPGDPSHGKTALHWAYGRGYYDIVHALIDAGAMDTGVQNHYLIHKATQDAQLTIIKALITKQPALLEQGNGHGETPLLIAAKHAFEQGLAYYIAQGADVNASAFKSGHMSHKTALHWAYEVGMYASLNRLVEHGAVDTRVQGEYVFEKAIQDGRLDVIKLLSESQPHFWKKNKQLINTWIGLAAGRMSTNGFDGHRFLEPGWPDVVEYLALMADSQRVKLAPRAMKYIEESKALTTDVHRTLSVFDLIARGANLDELIHKPGHPSHGKTAVEWAYVREHYIEMGLLLDAGAHVDYALGARLIFKAIACARVSTIERLLDEHPGLKQLQDGWFQHTPIDMILKQEAFAQARYPLIFAARKGYKHIVLDLIEKGENVNAVVNQPDNVSMHGKSVLRLALEARQFDVVEILRDAGAREWPYEVASLWSGYSLFSMPTTLREQGGWSLSSESTASDESSPGVVCRKRSIGSI